jgi:hypothetical protein
VILPLKLLSTSLVAALIPATPAPTITMFLLMFIIFELLNIRKKDVVSKIEATSL